MEKTLQMKSDNKDAQMNKVLDNYFDRIAKALPRKGRKTLLPDIKDGVESYLAENPDATVDDVIAYVGTPEDIVSEYYANLDGREISKEIKIGRKLVIILLLFLLALAVIFGITLAAMLVYNYCFPHEMIDLGTVKVITNSDLYPGSF